VPGRPQPNVVVPDLEALARELSRNAVTA
jgi:hypothetical protein